MSGNDLIFNFFSENDPKGLEVIKNIFLKSSAVLPINSYLITTIKKMCFKNS